MPLELSPEEFDLLADRVSRTASEYLAGLDGRASFPATSGAATAEVFDRRRSHRVRGLWARTRFLVQAVRHNPRGYDGYARNRHIAMERLGLFDRRQ
jgi:hypothetical protein